MTKQADRTPVRLLVAAGGGAVFAGSLAYFAVQYLRGFDAPPAADSGPGSAVAIDLALFSVFALHHSLFARTGLKRFVSSVVPSALERSVYVWIASLLFVATCYWWQPIPGVAWHARGWLDSLLRGVQIAGAVFTLVAARHLDVLELAGVRQALALPSTRPSGLDDYGPYGLVRHPIYLSWLMLVWPAPLMNGARIAFAAISTIYLLVAIQFEERDLRRTFGAAYDQYSRKVKWRVVPGVY